MKRPLDLRTLKQAARTLRAISHPERLILVQCLERGSRTVGELMVLTRVGQVRLSQHLGVLRRAGVVQRRASGSRRHYSILNPSVLHVLDCIRKNHTRGTA